MHPLCLLESTKQGQIHSNCHCHKGMHFPRLLWGVNRGVQTCLELFSPPCVSQTVEPVSREQSHKKEREKEGELLGRDVFPWLCRLDNRLRKEGRTREGRKGLWSIKGEDKPRELLKTEDSCRVRKDGGFLCKVSRVHLSPDELWTMIINHCVVFFSHQCTSSEQSKWTR